MHTATEARLEALEVKASFQEDLLDTLNQTVSTQQQQIQQLQGQLQWLYQQLQSLSPPGDAPAGGHEVPPHY